MVSFSPVSVGLYPLQRAIHGLSMGVILTTYCTNWDDPPSTLQIRNPLKDHSFWPNMPPKKMAATTTNKKHQHEPLFIYMYQGSPKKDFPAAKRKMCGDSCPCGVT